MEKKTIIKDILIIPKVLIEPLLYARQFAVWQTQRHNSDDGRLYVPNMTA